MATRFGAKSTTEDVLAGIELKGKRILVTGVSAGLGVETARALVAHGADVVGAARDLEKARRATAEVSQAAAANGASFELIELDLASLKSVRAAADKLVADGRLFDVIIANAGVMATPFGKTAGWFRDAIRDQSPGPLRLCEPHREADQGRRTPGQPRFLRAPFQQCRPERSQL
jgi:Short-chain dehydrogenases of various substrate specificities